MLDDPSCSQTLESTASTASEELYQLALDDPGCLHSLDGTASAAAGVPAERFPGNPCLTQDSPLWQGERTPFFWLRGREQDGVFRGQRPKTLGAIRALVERPHWPLRHKQTRRDYDCSQTWARAEELARRRRFASFNDPVQEAQLAADIAAEQERRADRDDYVPPRGWGPWNP